VLGICNGFQVLLEAGLLPGAMLRNASLQFRSIWTHVRVESTNTALTAFCRPRQVLRLPVAHGEGNYFVSQMLLDDLRRGDQVVLRYCEADGSITQRANPNGAADNIAGVCNEGRNIVALMPHPERASEPELGSTDGCVLFESMLRAQVLARA
jgi:phosphoribosylformylglycinamidine synthase I